MKNFKSFLSEALYGDAKTLAMLMGGGKKAPKKKTPSYKFSVGMNVNYCGKKAKIVGKEGRVWKVECDGQIWNSRGKDMKPETIGNIK